MSELATWLLAQLDEDERTDMGMPHFDRCRQFGGWPGEPETFEPCTCGVSARVLVEVEAKRAIVEWVQLDLGEGHSNHILRLLALPFADRPGFDETWRP